MPALVVPAVATIITGTHPRRHIVDSGGEYVGIHAPGTIGRGSSRRPRGGRCPPDGRYFEPGEMAFARDVEDRRAR